MVWNEAAHMAASLTLLQITSVDLMHPQSKALTPNGRAAMSEFSLFSG